MGNAKTEKTKKQRARAFVRSFLLQRGRCIWCGGRMWPGALMSEGYAISKHPETHSMSGSAKAEWLRDNRATVEHIMPRSIGGPPAYGLPVDSPNVVLAHALCNELRGANIKHKPHPQIVLWLRPKHRLAFERLLGEDEE